MLNSEEIEMYKSRFKKKSKKVAWLDMLFHVFFFLGLVLLSVLSLISIGRLFV